ncbi:MAG: CDC48 family AAA ATPase [Candidatus Nanoarchaeia archaeon]|jgi:transitional endoplasmic reticulum ATPase
MADDINNVEFQLKVAEAMQDDVGKGIVRIDSLIMKELGIKRGEPIEITGDKTTVAIADRCYPADIGLRIIRMDGLTRYNSKSAIGEAVNIKPAEFKEAKKITLSPTDENIKLNINAATLKRSLLGRFVREDDTITLGGTRSRRISLRGSENFADIFKMIEEDINSFMPSTESGMGFGPEIKLVVSKTNPKTNVVITDVTEIDYDPTPVANKQKIPDITYEDIGGLTDEVKKVREMVELPMRHPEVFEKLGIQPPKGVLLHGPPGTGKTLLAKAVAGESEANFVSLNGPEIMSKWVGEAEKQLRKIFEDAEKKAPSIIFIDEIDAIASKRQDNSGEVERRVVAQLLAIMDGLKGRKVIVMAATNRPNSLDPALRRPGRFDREIEIGVPSREGRLEILKIHTRNMPIEGEWNNDSAVKEILLNIDSMLKTKEKGSINLREKELIELRKLFLKTENKDFIENILLSIKEISFSNEILSDLIAESKNNFLKIAKDKTSKKEVEIIESLIMFNILNKSFYERVKHRSASDYLKYLANKTHGFVGADLESLCREAAMNVIRKLIPDIDWDKDDKVSEDKLKNVVVSKEDFDYGFRVVRPSAMREVIVQIPNIKWTDIGGLEEVKQMLKESVEWPIKHAENFKKLGIRPPRGILLYGPPGTGKTMLAKAAAKETEMNFISIKGPELLSKWVGESEKAVRETFRKARQVAPCIIFFDEIDSLVPRRGLRSDSSGVTEQVVNQLLTELDGLEELQNVIIIAATNRPDMIDPGMLRPGRLDRLIMVPAPDEAARIEIMKVHTQNMPLAKTVKIEELAKNMENYTGADIENVCREAAMIALRENIESKEVTLKNFKQALENSKPSVDEETINMYSYFNEKAKEKQKEEIKQGLSYLG